MVMSRRTALHIVVTLGLMAGGVYGLMWLAEGKKQFERDFLEVNNIELALMEFAWTYGRMPYGWVELARRSDFVKLDGKGCIVVKTVYPEDSDDYPRDYGEEWISIEASKYGIAKGASFEDLREFDRSSGRSGVSPARLLYYRQGGVFDDSQMERHSRRIAETIVRRAAKEE
jgi:hypothetical protein